MSLVSSPEATQLFVMFTHYIWYKYIVIIGYTVSTQNMICIYIVITLYDN